MRTSGAAGTGQEGLTSAELGRESRQRALELLEIRESFIDYVAMAESMGVPATQAETAEQFHEQFATAMKEKGPHFIDAKIESVEALIVAKHGEAYEAAHPKPELA